MVKNEGGGHAARKGVEEEEKSLKLKAAKRVMGLTDTKN